MNPFPFFALSFISHLVLLSSAEEKKQNQTSCPTLFCSKFEFPFKDQKHPDCGLYTVNCSKPVPKIQFKEGGHWFPVENISRSKKILINDTSSRSRLDPRSCESIESFTLPNTSFSYANFTDSWTLFNCSHSLGISTVPTEFNRTICGDNDIYYTRLLNTSFPSAKQCSTIQLPPLSNRTQDNEFLFATSFTVEVFVTRECFDCHYRGGQCETNSTNNFYCSIKGMCTSAKIPAYKRTSLICYCYLESIHCPIPFLLWIWNYKTFFFVFFRYGLRGLYIDFPPHIMILLNVNFIGSLTVPLIFVIHDVSGHKDLAWKLGIGMLHL